MDDAIIAIEMMVVKMEEGYDRLKASAYAWSHTAAPMLAGTLVTAVGFMPNGFAQSTAGEYASNVFWIVGIALIASWIVAVIFTPWLGVHLLPERKSAAAGHAALYDTPRYQRFRRLLTRVIAGKWRVAAGVVVLFMVALLGMSVVKKQFFPTSDRPEVLVEVQMPYGSSIIQTSAATAKIERWLQQQPEAKIVTSYIGQGAPRFYLAMAPELPDPSFAKLVVLTDGPASRERLSCGCGRRWPMALRRRRGCASRSWSLALFALSSRLAGDGARSAHPARHRRSGESGAAGQSADAHRQ